MWTMLFLSLGPRVCKIRAFRAGTFTILIFLDVDEMGLTIFAYDTKHYLPLHDLQAEINYFP